MPLVRSSSQTRFALLGLSLAAALALMPGCNRQPQIAAVNRELIISLATAVSTQNPQWLEKNAKQIEQHQAEGKLSETEYRIFSAIVAQARSGDWQGAEDAVYALRDGQEPTAEDRQKAAQRQLAPDHPAPPKTQTKTQKRR